MTNLQMTNLQRNIVVLFPRVAHLFALESGECFGDAAEVQPRRRPMIE